MSVADQVVANARSALGLPYKWGSADPSAGGLDCSGLVDWAYKAAGHPFKGRLVASQLGKLGIPVSAGQAQPGDIVYYDEPGSVDHVGIYIGDGDMIDAPHAGASVRIDPIGRPTSIRHIVGSLSGLPGAGWTGGTGGPIGSKASGTATDTATTLLGQLLGDWQSNLLAIGITVLGAAGAVALVVVGAKQTVERN